MKLQFEPNLDYQREAIEAVCDLFRGQEICRSEFTVSRRPLALAGAAGQGELELGTAFGPAQGRLDLLESGLGIGNRLGLLPEELLENLHAIQLRHGLPPSEALTSMDFTVEMETGTGKTYVYLRTIFELNRRYGFTKFVIVVPSVAIKEGVMHTLKITEDHLKGLYGGAPYDPFQYDSAKLGQVRSFATSSLIQIMVVTVGAINKLGANLFHQPNEKTNDEKPIDLVRQVRPIVILDEPQSIQGGARGKGRAAVEGMRPLAIFHYSATPDVKHQLVYRLDAVDAYERKLVKQIEVAAATIEDAHNKPYVRLVRTVSRKKAGISAIVELDMAGATGVRRVETTVHSGDDLEQKTGRAIYRDCRIGEISAIRGREAIEVRIPGGERFLAPDESVGDVDSAAVHRHMIRRTIREHLEKERRLRPRKIKVLSLFFVDSVEKYRRYVDGKPEKGEYARVFEEEYRQLVKHPDFRDLFESADLGAPAEEVHDGYFSIDKKGTWTESEEGEGNQATRDNAERAYNLIMREKERLLSFETPLKFIFSHSALREGWDNPNVFQICALRDIRTERERRQTLGRGLRLAVNQDGERQRGFEINTLTVVARESYEEFAEKLQKEIEEETGIQFGVVQPHQFAAVAVEGAGGTTTPLGFEQSKALWEALKAQGHLDAAGKVQDSLRTALKEGTLTLPEPFAAELPQVREILRKLAGRLEIRNADDRKVVRPRQAVLWSAEFKALWDRIKHKTTYRVRFDNEKLIAGCARALSDAPAIPKTRLQWQKAELAIGVGGVTATEREGAATVAIDEDLGALPDLLTVLEDRTKLTRRSLHRIVVESRRLPDFARNPQTFLDIAARAIHEQKRLALVDGIRYQRLGDQYYYAQELFESEELATYLKELIPAERSVYEYVVYDSETVERSFALDLNNNSAVKVYAKLPPWFKVPTPLGTYNPDWAVLVEREDAERLYFVVETKGSLFSGDLRAKEKAKIDCGAVHFKALADEVREEPAEYVVATTVSELLARSVQ